ncbi:MAG: helix-turn-helix domain-containing protein [Sporichthyaceae bacterium]|nr:helix-turn-helix domain-containing protein [Sporichthyaceae bacterium]
MGAPLKIPDVSAMTGIPEATLRFYRHQGTGPRSFKLGRRVMYREEDVLAIEERYANEPTPAA